MEFTWVLGHSFSSYHWSSFFKSRHWETNIFAFPSSNKMCMGSKELEKSGDFILYIFYGEKKEKKKKNTAKRDESWPEFQA